MKRLYAALVATSCAILPAQASPPSDRPYAAALSIEDLRFAIAWYGAACLLGASELDVYGSSVRLDDVAAESGVSSERIREMAEIRNSEYSIAVAVLRRGGEPLRDPPEPFLTILRQAQSDCQDLERSRRMLERELQVNTLPDVTPTRSSNLRRELDPLPFDFERRQRLQMVIQSRREALDSGDFEAEVVALMRAVSLRDTLTLDQIENALRLYALTPGIDPPLALATDLLLPDPDMFRDLTEAELAEVQRRLVADPSGEFARYYGWLLLANADRLGTDATLTWFDQSGNPVDPNDFELPDCQRIAGSAALTCPMAP